ncbi:hypothetical protein [Pseudalkalibacillus sp. SCS-8]|uniref:hypothetical protein n=1 Tax=Pseudalkalibacillus nanhaiensis TaxID=3115291 RepID=UPI0032DBEB09
MSLFSDDNWGCKKSKKKKCDSFGCALVKQLNVGDRVRITFGDDYFLITTTDPTSTAAVLKFMCFDEELCAATFVSEDPNRSQNLDLPVTVDCRKIVGIQYWGNRDQRGGSGAAE